jgi:zinc transport system substrate-binding protein
MEPCVPPSRSPCCARPPSPSPAAATPRPRGRPAPRPPTRSRSSSGVYPYAYLAERVGGDGVEVTNLASPGTEPHDLELTPRQVGTIGAADLVVHSPGFQPAVDEAVEQQAADRALDVLDAVELRDAPEGEHGATGRARGGEHEGDGHAHEGRRPARLARPRAPGHDRDRVADRLAELDPDSADDYRARADELADELTGLDGELRAGLSSCERQEIVTSHDAFGYLADAYGLEQVAVAGLSPEDEASPRRLAEVAAQAQAAGVTTIFFEESVSPKVAESLAREVGATATVLSPLELAPESGDYLTAMRDNLERLRTALGCS